MAAALGRVMAIVRIGGRRPTAEELASARGAGSAWPAGRPARSPARRRPVPAAVRPGLRHAPAAGPALAAPRRVPLRRRRPRRADPVRRRRRPPRDRPARRRGPVQRPADRRGRASCRPTRVCVYAPRFAAVRRQRRPNADRSVRRPCRGANDRAEAASRRDPPGPERLAQNQAAELNRHRVPRLRLRRPRLRRRPTELRVLAATTRSTHIAGNVKVERAEGQSSRRQGHR